MLALKQQTSIRFSWRKLVQRTTLFAVAVALICFTIIQWAHFNFFVGEYFYNPRTEQPDPSFMVQRPDQTLVRFFDQHVIGEGLSYPYVSGTGQPESNTGRRVIRVEPLRVSANLYTDWHAFADVQARIYYADGSTRDETFNFMAAGRPGHILFMEADTQLRFGDLVRCNPSYERQPELSYCTSIQLS